LYRNAANEANLKNLCVSIRRIAEEMCRYNPRLEDRPECSNGHDRGVAKRLSEGV
jgi:hypothetical protein